MTRLGLEREIVEQGAYERAVSRFKEQRIRLPKFSELADPALIPDSVRTSLDGVDPDAADPRNLFRVHWYNAADRRARLSVPDHLVLPQKLTGVRAPIVVALGTNFPMIRAHKVLAAYGCLAPRIVTGQFDPTEHKAIWPSTGNYCRGGVAISRIMGCRGVAVLPEGMSRERFDWLARWVSHPDDVILTPGSESNVKEIYDECGQLEKDPQNVIFNQFREFGNHLVHWACTGRALETVHESLRRERPDLEIAAYVSATGSAGTLAAGDYVKEKTGAKIAAVEALECPTLLYNGYGEHNIQGIGDKHVPLIHNVMNTDFVIAVSDRASDSSNVLFNSTAGRDYLVKRHGVDAALLDRMPALGLSSLANVLASIKLAKYLDLAEHEAVFTVATDGAELYETELDKAGEKLFPDGFDALAAAETFGRYWLGAATDHLLELTRPDRRRIFNLGYFTWVEQQGVPIHEFDRRLSPEFWTGLQDLLPAWDAMIDEFNSRTGIAAD
jgi:cysteine synthase